MDDASDSRGPGSVPAQAPAKQNSSVRATSHWTSTGIFILLAIGAIAYARVFLIPVVLALLLALVFTPIRRFLSRRYVPSWLTSSAIVMLLLTLLVGGISLVAQPATELIDSIPELSEKLEEKLLKMRGSARAIIEATEQVDEIAEAIDTNPAQEVVIRGPGFFPTLATLAPSFLAQTLFTLVLLFFVLASGDMFYEKIVYVIPSLTDKKRAVALARDIESKLSRYFATITLINGMLGVVIGVVMWQLGLPDPVLFGVMAAVFNFVPYLGALAGVCVTAVVGLLTFDQLWTGLTPALVYFGITMVEGQLLAPALVGRRLELNTVVVFVSVALWAWLWSVMGMLMAVPLLVTLRTLCEHIPAMESVGAFLSARGVEKDLSAGSGGETSDPH